MGNHDRGVIAGNQPPHDRPREAVATPGSIAANYGTHIQIIASVKLGCPGRHRATQAVLMNLGLPGSRRRARQDSARTIDAAGVSEPGRFAKQSIAFRLTLVSIG
jgi:hypothetical protein